jgi:DnaJ-like protein
VTRFTLGEALRRAGASGAPGQSFARLHALGDGTLAFQTSFHPELVADLKRHIPFTGRRWDGERKRWLVDPLHAQTCIDLAQRHLGVTITAPRVDVTPPPQETRLIELEYLGACKERDDGSVTASGWANGAWTLVIPEAVLLDWWCPDPETARRPDTPAKRAASITLFGVLGLAQTATLEQVKAAYRRLARSVHPDVNHEPDATEQFLRVQRAYEVLGNPATRVRYELGLRLEAREQPPSVAFDDPARFRPMLRCGWVLCEGTPKLGQFHVSRVLGWEDIADGQGRVLVTSWPPGAKTFRKEWV